MLTALKAGILYILSHAVLWGPSLFTVMWNLS